MNRLGLFGGRRDNASSQSLTAAEEPDALAQAMAAAAHVLNDDVELAESELAKGDSPFHKVGRGMVAFLRAVLGFEQEVMRDAAAKLEIAEAAAAEHRRRAHRDGHHSAIYPIGSEYALCDAETQLMTAVVAVLNESLTESLKGFYRLRKAYTTLQEISDAEKKYITEKLGPAPIDNTLQVPSRPGTANGGQSFFSSGRNSGIASKAPSRPSSGIFKRPVSGIVPPHNAHNVNNGNDDNDPEFVDADEDHGDTAVTDKYQGHVEHNRLSAAFGALRLGRPGPTRQASHLSIATAASVVSTADDHNEYEQAVADLFIDPIDQFIHTGTNQSFGMLQLILSLVPPTFAKLLSIVGFRGDRDAGIAMLWNATNYDDINGSMSGLILLGYYNNMVSFCDILTTNSYPKKRCRALLTKMRAKYPDSRLWLLEESRMLAGDRRLEDAITLIRGPEASTLKQIEALRCFECSLNLMYQHKYQECADGFVKCVGMNNWSHGLYLFIAGSCYVELYRLAKASTSPEEKERAAKYASRATELLNQVPGKTKKKGLMGRQLPFDAFVNRKIAKWTAYAAALSVPIVDGVGVCPIEELIYFWNGYKRMSSSDLEVSFQRLETYSTSSLNPAWDSAAEDEQAMLHLLTACITARLGLTPEAREIINTQVLPVDPSVFRGGNRDNWILPVANYEMAVIAWEEAGREKGVGKADAKLQECADWIQKVVNWESYDLDARVGMKVRTAQDTLKKIGITASASI